MPGTALTHRTTTIMPLVDGADPFIGREREMAELTAALDSALEGRGGLVMLAGEPGTGFANGKPARSPLTRIAPSAMLTEKVRSLYKTG